MFRVTLQSICVILILVFYLCSSSISVILILLYYLCHSLHFLNICACVIYYVAIISML